MHQQRCLASKFCFCSSLLAVRPDRTKVGKRDEICRCKVVCYTDDYYSLVGKYFANKSRTMHCINEQKKNGWRFLESEDGATHLGLRTSFMVVGIEGVGHHLLANLDPRLAGTSRATNLKSYPHGFDWRSSHNASHRINIEASCPNLIELQKYSRLLVLTRDPIDAHYSAIRRFWSPSKYENDTLAREQFAFVRTSVLN